MPNMVNVMSTLTMIAGLGTLIMVVRLIRLGVWDMERESFREITRQPLVRLFQILAVISATFLIISATASLFRYEPLARYSAPANLLTPSLLLAFFVSIEATFRSRRSGNDPA